MFGYMKARFCRLAFVGSLLSLSPQRHFLVLIKALVGSVLQVNVLSRCGYDGAPWDFPPSQEPARYSADAILFRFLCYFVVIRRRVPLQIEGLDLSVCGSLVQAPFCEDMLLSICVEMRMQQQGSKWKWRIVFAVLYYGLLLPPVSSIDPCSRSSN